MAVDGCSSVDWNCMKVFKKGAEAVNFFAHLHTKFACRAENDSLSVSARKVQLHERWQAECGCFTRARLGEPNDVFAFECNRDGRSLNR